jgi:PD-(D/E)XK nuclease superfamily
LGIEASSEVLTNKARIDMVATTNTHVFIFEFKLHASAQTALKQIEDKQYYEKYILTKKKIVLVGISFALDQEKPKIECACKEIKHPL